MSTVLDIAKAAVDLADANPEFVYDRGEGGNCLYLDRLDETHGGCLFGQAIIETLGATPEVLGVLAEADSQVRTEPISIQFLLERLANKGLIDGFVNGEIYYLLVAMSSAQGSQDTGCPWGEAVDGLRLEVLP